MDQQCPPNLHLIIFFISQVQVVTDLDGNFIVQIGSSGEEGLRDGSFDEAMFNRPQVTLYSKSISL